LTDAGTSRVHHRQARDMVIFRICVRV
jgi:hypothetical protein